MSKSNHNKLRNTTLQIKTITPNEAQLDFL